MKNDVVNELEKVIGNGRIRQNEPMSAHTTFKIGGPAEYYVDVNTIDEFINIVKAARKHTLPIFILGGGANIIVSEKGIKGLVIKNNCRRFETAMMSGRVKNKKIDVQKALVYAEAGVLMGQLVRFTIEQGLSGLEHQMGLPGTVGGAVFMNSNFPKKQAYVGDAVYRTKLLTPQGEVKEVDQSYFRFAYDYSILQKTGEIVLAVVFALIPEKKEILWKRGNQALEYRLGTQPKGASAGCTFRNISVVDAITIPTPGQTTSAGYLIDKAGLKGKRIGDAMISDVHANFILNIGKATADDVIALVKLIKEEVYKKFGVQLHLEVRNVGF